jgi:hypothetical protein
MKLGKDNFNLIITAVSVLNAVMWTLQLEFALGRFGPFCLFGLQTSAGTRNPRTDPNSLKDTSGSKNHILADTFDQLRNICAGGGVRVRTNKRCKNVENDNR